jgi:dolichol-phosphate mannosyltransferase
VLEFVRRILSKEQRRFIKFCVVGGSGVPVNLLCSHLGRTLIFVGLDDAWRTGLAYIFGIVISIFTNFLLNDVWTWKDRDKANRGFAARLLRFYLVSALGSGIQFGVAMGLSLGLELHFSLSQLVGIAIATGVNFVINNWWTFGDKGQGKGQAPSGRVK